MRVWNTGRRQTLVWAVAVLALVAGCAKKQPPIARPTAPVDSGMSGATRPLPPPPAAGPRGSNGAAGGAGDDGDRPGLEVARRSQPGVALQAGLLPLGQFRDQPGRAGRAQRQRGTAQALWRLGGHRRGALRRARHGRVQPGARRTPGPGRPQLPGVAGHCRRSPPDGELREGVSLRSRAGPRRPLPGTGVRTSWSRPSSAIRGVT